MTSPVIEAEGVTRVLPGAVPVTLVRDIDFQARAGELIAITGPSGSGKSSLLYLLGLLDVPASGRIVLEGRETESLSPAELAAVRLRRLGFVFQFHFLLPEFSALQNVLIPMRKLGRLSATDMEARGHALLASLDLDRLADKKPHQLSGGERQRVAIARALANDPVLILADEPTGNLDTRNSGIVFDIFERLANEEGKTVLTVTHDPTLAARTHRQVRLVDGRIVDGGIGDGAAAEIGSTGLPKQG